MRTETGIRIFIRTIKITIVVCSILLAWRGWFTYEEYKYYNDSPTPAIEKSITLDKVYVINLDRSKDRYAKIKGNLDDVGLSHTRVKAIDGYDLDIENDVGQKFKGASLKSGDHSINPHKLYKVLCPSKALIHHPYNLPDKRSNGEKRKVMTCRNKLLSAGEYGCYCSHLGVWKEMIDNNIAYALILEDDAHFAPGSSQKLDQVLKHAPYDFDIIYLFISYGRFKRFSPYVELTTGPLHSQVAYILSLKGAKKLWKQVNSPARPIDILVSDLVERSSIKAYASSDRFVTTPYPASHPQLSIIEDMFLNATPLTATTSAPKTHRFKACTEIY